MARPDYEQSSESGRERHLNIPYSRLLDVTPTLHDPACVTGLPVGTQLTGTVVTLDATDSEAVINHARGAVYRHYLRNVATYNGGVEATWRAIQVGDAVYYDASATMPATAKLSLSPLNNLGAANTLFGWVVLDQEEDSTDFGKGTTQAGSTWLCAVAQA